MSNLFDHIMTQTEIDEFMDDLAMELGFELDPILSYSQQADEFENNAKKIQDPIISESYLRMAKNLKDADKAWFCLYHV